MRWQGAAVSAENLPALIPEPDGRAARFAAAFAASTDEPHTSAARRRDLLGASGPPRRGSRPARTPAWVPWCVARGIDPLGEVRAAYLLAWLVDLAAGGDAESTRNRRLSTVSAWYRYLKREQEVLVNPVDLLSSAEKPKSAKKIYRTSPTPTPTAEQVRRLQEVADSHSRLAAAFVSLLANTGVRISELARANVASIGQDRGHAILTVTGKGGAVKTVPMPPATWHRVFEYLESRSTDGDRLPTLTVGAGHDRPLFARGNGNRMCRQELAKLLDRLIAKAGLEQHRFSPHSMRNAFITDLLDAGVPIYDVQRAVGHVSPETTIRYDKSHLDPDRHPAYRRAAQLAAVRDRRRDENGD